MMRLADSMKQRARKSRQSRAALLEACAGIAAEGRPITLEALSEMTGSRVEAIRSKVYRMMLVGEFPYRIAKGVSR